MLSSIQLQFETGQFLIGEKDFLILLITTPLWLVHMVQLPCRICTVLFCFANLLWLPTKEASTLIIHQIFWNVYDWSK